MPVVGTKAAASAQGFGEFAQASSAPVYIESVFSTYLYTGNGSTQTITNGIDLSGKGGMVWLKARSFAGQNNLFDTTRTGDLFTDSTSAQSAGYVPTYFNFNSNGFFIGQGNDYNDSSANYASWTFRKQPKFFDVVTYTGSNSAQTISHSLGSAPGCIIIKKLDSINGNADWSVYHRSLTTPNEYYLALNTTAAQATYGSGVSYIYNVTSTSFSLGGGFTAINRTSSTYVAYLFAHNAGGFGLTGTDNVISCGSFTTNASGNATVTLGYEPQFVLYKASSTTEDWNIADVMRNFNQTSLSRLKPNVSDAETTASGNYLFPTATGFTSANGWLTANTTYIYIAIRRGPMKTPTSGTSVFKVPYVRTGGGATQDITAASYPVNDLVITKSTSNTQTWAWTDRLRGATKELTSASTAAEATYANDLTSFAFMNGFQVGSGAGGQMNTSGYTYIDYTFRRAPGFFDEVCYTGTGGNPQTVNHNLGVAPNMVIVKRRDNATPNWTVGLSFTSTPYQDGLYLNATNALIAGDNELNGASATTISVRNTMSASGGTFVAYLFATCSGVSKVGSFTGTGNVLQIDCGFTGGARFVLIKATSTTGSWYVWDSVRGIVAGNDPYLLLNSTAAEVTNTDWVDAYSAGFELSNAVGNTVNTNGTTYMYLAIA